MTLEQQLQNWLTQRIPSRAIICDIDETLCTQFDIAIPKAIDVMQRISDDITVYYITARPTQTRTATMAFLEQHRLPTTQNLYLCEPWKTTLRHKRERMTEAAQEHLVLLSIGDAEEDAIASEQAGVPFHRICRMHPEESWRAIEAQFLADGTIVQTNEQKDSNITIKGQ